jgi:signal transduction histidine kinase
LRRRSIRLRLTALYSGLFLGSSAVLLTVTYLLVAHLPIAVARVVTGYSRPTAGQAPPSLPPIGEEAARQRSADLHALLAQSGVALVVMALVAIGLGWLVAGRVLRPLRTITATTRRISADNLHQRLAITGPVDELKGLADTIDALLARLERAFAAQRQFVANASHELRTPLTLQRALLEATLTEPDATTHDWRATGERVLAVGEQQEQMIEALLTLARSEAGLGGRERTDLATIMARVLDSRRDEAATRGVRLVANLGPALIAGDPALVERLAANLVDNALVHNVAPDGGPGVQRWAEVRTATVDTAAILTVTNTGPVVPGTDVARLFEPFERLTGRRTGNNSGLGLGLSIVRAIGIAHDADVVARPRNGGGLEVEVRFARHDQTGGDPVSASGPRLDGSERQRNRLRAFRGAGA